jgi:hypothetical protein
MNYKDPGRIGTFEELLAMNPAEVVSIEVKPKMPKPEDDARLPILEAEIERQWRSCRTKYLTLLRKEKRLKHQVRETALMCVHVLQQYEANGLGADQGREAIQGLILPGD